MNKFKRIIILFKYPILKMSRILGPKHYKKKSYKYFKFCGIDFPKGAPKFICFDLDFDMFACEKIHIGNNTVIAKKCIILVHDYSIECGLTAINKNNKEYESLFIKDVWIGDNSFIGARTFILPGAKIGNNCIIGAGSVVAGNIPDNSIAAGNPCKVITDIHSWATKKYEEKQFVKGTKN